MLSLLMIALPLATAITVDYPTDGSNIPQYALDGSYNTDGSYVPQYAVDGSYARDGNSVDGPYARDGNFNIMPSTRKYHDASIGGNFFDINGYFFQGVMIVSVAFLLANLLGFNLFPGLTAVSSFLKFSLILTVLFNINM